MTTTDATTLAAAYLPCQDQRKGMFIVLEGISGSGKSTIAALLAQRLRGRLLHAIPAPVGESRTFFDAGARPLPELAFHLAGLLQASDVARDALQNGHVVADQYVNSVIANHAARHGLDNSTVALALAPFTNYLAAADLTVYLHASPAELTRRMRAKDDQTMADLDLLTDPDLLGRLQDRFDQIAATDPTARHLQTTRRSPAELADRIMAMLPVMSIARLELTPALAQSDWGNAGISPMRLIDIR